MLSIKLFHIFEPLAVPSDQCAVDTWLDLANSATSKPDACISWSISPGG